MQIQKEIRSKIERDYFFIEGELDLNAQYFINKINENVESKNNLNYKTNISGKHTSWELFNKDKEFSIVLCQIKDFLDESKILKHKCYLKEVWGIREDFGDITREHHHLPAYLSGIIYLNNHSQKLYLPEIKKEVLPTCGKIVLFPSFLIHYTKRNITNDSKYAISFNFNYATISD
jgi:hypothetical protein